MQFTGNETDADSEASTPFPYVNIVDMAVLYLDDELDREDLPLIGPNSEPLPSGRKQHGSRRGHHHEAPARGLDGSAAEVRDQLLAHLTRGRLPTRPLARVTDNVSYSHPQLHLRAGGYEVWPAERICAYRRAGHDWEYVVCGVAVPDSGGAPGSRAVDWSRVREVMRGLVAGVSWWRSLNSGVK